VAEVGAGIGSNTRTVDPGGTGRWVCLEPDRQLVSQLEENLKQSGERRYETVCGTLQALGDQQFDTIIYIDVLEHIEEDEEELKVAADHLRLGGHLIVLSPAHQCLFTSFDAAIGHFRRYNSSMLRRISPVNVRLRKMRYLDSVGLLASTANLLFLRQAMPTQKQLQFWDQCIVPISLILDRVFFYSIGKTIIAIWEKPAV
jgi:2-polyprenyl-3-methyl-5-hydroxy-6-metoxy-1,4-benzoquinol methylase